MLHPKNIIVSLYISRVTDSVQMTLCEMQKNIIRFEFVTIFRFVSIYSGFIAVREHLHFANESNQPRKNGRGKENCSIIQLALHLTLYRSFIRAIHSLLACTFLRR